MAKAALPATTRHQLIISVDPGAKGGIGCLRLGGEVVKLVKTPDSLQDVADVVRDLIKENPDSNPLFVLELVTDRAISDGEGGFRQRTGSGKLMYHAGAMEGIARTLGLAFREVQPNVWMTRLNCRTGVMVNGKKKTDKNITKRKAQELFPAIKFTHATADAILIGEYARLSLLEGKF